MSSKSKNKGKGFEREVAKFLSDLYKDSFTRVIDSGAFTGGKNSHRRDTLTQGQVRARKGDIVPPDHWHYFNCECKNYAEFPFHQLLSNKPILILEDWIAQTLEAAEPGDCNIIFMKFNRRGRYVLYQLPEIFETHRSVDYKDKQGRHWRFTNFEDFFSLNAESFRNRSQDTQSNIQNQNNSGTQPSTS